MRPIGLDRKSKDYLDTLNIDPYAFEERFIYLETLIKANLAFKTKLENFKQFIDCLSADRCFALWIGETEDLIIQSEACLQDFGHDQITEQQFVKEHVALADRMLELAKARVYEGHWEYGVASEVDQQFNDLTELCRRIWSKESKAWLTLAKAWNKIDIHLIVHNDEHV
ncbi:hypothetical protein [Acinetobacter ursingii]|uniref:hypothetical protein n=1 Tax=Acinetobacter ursingii TaxID=108980 RepID=UPI00300A5245